MSTDNPRIARVFAISALAAGALAAWLVSDYTGSVERQGGPPVAVLVAAHAIPRGEAISGAMLGQSILVRTVPRRFAPADAVRTIDELEAARSITDIGEGAYLTAPLFAGGADTGSGYRLRRNERAISIDTKIAPEGASPQPGAVVDVFASGFAGRSETSLLLSNAEVLANSDSAGSQQRLTLRVAAEQVPNLIRGDVFARELRTITRP